MQQNPDKLNLTSYDIVVSWLSTGDALHARTTLVGHLCGVGVVDRGTSFDSSQSTLTPARFDYHLPWWSVHVSIRPSDNSSRQRPWSSTAAFFVPRSTIFNFILYLLLWLDRSAMFVSSARFTISVYGTLCRHRHFRPLNGVLTQCITLLHCHFMWPWLEAIYIREARIVSLSYLLVDLLTRALEC